MGSTVSWTPLELGISIIKKTYDIRATTKWRAPRTMEFTKCNDTLLIEYHGRRVVRMWSIFYEYLSF